LRERRSGWNGARVTLRAIVLGALGALVVTAIGSCVSGVVERRRLFQRVTTHTSARELQLAAEMWRKTHRDECPTPPRLVRDRRIDLQSDAWGQPFRVTCKGDTIVVASAGPDERYGTADDIRSDDASFVRGE
jgi:hypothetical protein